MSLDRDPIGRVRDAMIATPVVLSIAARRAAPMLLRLGRRQARRIGHIITVAQHTGSAREPVADVPAPSSPDPYVSIDSVVEAEATSERTNPIVPLVESLPIDGYDNLAARQVVDRLATLLPGDLAIIEAYERAHRHRQTVLGRIGQLST